VTLWRADRNKQKSHAWAHLVDEEVVTAAVGGDEAEALGGVEPLDGSAAAEGSSQSSVP